MLEQLTETEMETYKLHRRFDRMGRLVGDDRMKKLMNSHIMIIGLGGVGSWAAESIARSGVGKITVVDFDEVCITNFNRQLHALTGNVGTPKSKLMQERLAKINPQAKIVGIDLFYNQANHDAIFTEKPDYVIDAIDHVTSKCFLLAFCRKNNIPIITSTGSGGRIDPTQIKITDLALTERDPLARDVRRILRADYGFPTEGTYGIAAIYSTEPASKPYELSYDNGKGFRCVCPQGDNTLFNCDSRNLIYGNSSFVTGSFGLFAASRVVSDLIQSVSVH
ncbi:MAG: tRNA threonylcarbamoyladenosine dehydratase [Xanthomonadaceae bacterium]|nr:tRNA threonylcarbamoyladenosine dehydratase [Xanthomonadaceae bacterium]